VWMVDFKALLSWGTPAVTGQDIYTGIGGGLLYQATPCQTEKPIGKGGGGQVDSKRSKPPTLGTPNWGPWGQRRKGGWAKRFFMGAKNRQNIRRRLHGRRGGGEKTDDMRPLVFRGRRFKS